MTTKIDDPKVQVRRLLSSEWLIANSMAAQPKISTGWWSGNKKTPQVVAAYPEDTPIQRGLHQSGGITQVRSGFLVVASFATEFSIAGSPPSEVGVAGAKNLVYLCMQEADRIITAAFLNDQLPDFTKLEVGTIREPVPVAGESPVVYSRYMFVNYDWIKTPV